MSTLFRDNVPELLQVGLNEVFFEAYNLIGNQWEDIFNVETTDRKSLSDVGYAGFSTVPEKDEGDAITYERIQEAYKKTYTMRTFAKGFRVTLEARDDDQYGVIANASRQLGNVLAYTENQDAANVFNRAFNTSYTGPDGVTLCNSAHPLKGGGTAANRPGTDVDISVAAVQAALTRFRNQVNEMGLNILLVPKIFAVPTASEFLAATVLQKGGLPGTADHDRNVLADLYSLRTKIWHFLTDSDAWFLISDKSMHRLKWFWRMRPVTDTDGDFDTKDIKFSIVARWDVSFSDWRGIDGSQGA